MNNIKEKSNSVQVSYDDWDYVNSLNSHQINKMLSELTLEKANLELKLFKAGTRASRMRLCEPLENIVMLIGILSYVQLLRIRQT